MVGHAFNPSTEETEAGKSEFEARLHNKFQASRSTKTWSSNVFFFRKRLTIRQKQYVFFSITFSLKMQNVKSGLVICTPAILSQTKT